MKPSTCFIDYPVRACCLAAAIVFSIGNTWAAGTEYEAPPYFKASDVLPKDVLSGPNHRVDPTIKNDGMMDRYIVTSQYGSVEAGSKADLYEVIHEFNVTAQLDALKGTQQFAEGMKKSAGKAFDGAKKLATHPIDSLGGAVSGVTKMFKRTSDNIFGDPPADSQDGRIKALSGYTAVKRAYAQQFGVDPYSDNPYLQEQLDDVAWAAYAGSITASLAFSAVSGGAGAALTVTRGVSTLTKADLSRAPSDLRAENEQKLLAMGVSSDVAELFLNNDAYPPSLQTYLVGALDQMSGVESRDAFVKAALQTDQRDVATYRRRQAEMFAGYHLKVAPFTRFYAAKGGSAAVAETKDGTIVLVAPTDYVSWTSIIGRAFEGAALNPVMQGKNKEVWVTGGVSARAKQELEALGWKVVDKADGKLFN